MKVYVDANPTMIAYLTEEGKPYRETIEMCTHNEAEYKAVIKALQDNPGDVEIVSDSMLIVLQLRGVNRVRDWKMELLHGKVRKLCEGRKITFTWIDGRANPAHHVVRR